MNPELLAMAVRVPRRHDSVFLLNMSGILNHVKKKTIQM